MLETLQRYTPKIPEAAEIAKEQAPYPLAGEFELEEPTSEFHPTFVLDEYKADFFAAKKQSHADFQKSRTGRLLNKAFKKQGVEYMESRSKRNLDLAVAMPGSIIAAPLVVMLAIGNKIEARRDDSVENSAPMFFKEERIGKYGKPFNVWKLRTMKPNSDTSEARAANFGKHGCEDDRNTKMGKFMRKFDIDELPQIFQVLTGNMSIIGLRPAPQYVLDQLREEYGEEEFVKWLVVYSVSSKGIASPNALMLPRNKVNGERYLADLFYHENASVATDVWLMREAGIEIGGKVAKAAQEKVASKINQRKAV